MSLGNFTFSALRGWSAADSLYFSFAALATIGIFDGPTAAAPEAAPLSSSVGTAAADESAAGSGGGGRQALFVTACTLYLLFGLALVAMCFNLIVMDRAYARWQRMQGASVSRELCKLIHQFTGKFLDGLGFGKFFGWWQWWATIMSTTT